MAAFELLHTGRDVLARRNQLPHADEGFYDDDARAYP
jgi:hypothetical protein